MKKAYLIIIYSITLICVIIGIVSHTVKWVGFNFIKPASQKIEEYDADLAGVKDNITITIDCRIGDVKVERGEKYHLKYSAVVDLETQVETREDAISIIQKKNVKTWGNNTGSDLILTIPNGVNVEYLDIHNDLGDIDVNDIAFEKGVIDENLGDIKVNTCKFTDLNISNDLGDIKVLSCEGVKDYTIDTDVSLGEIKFFDDKYGDKFKKEGSKGTLTIDNSLGDITVK